MPDNNQNPPANYLNDVLTLLGAGGAAKGLVASKPILGAIIGPKAKGWNQVNENLAKQMLGQGKTAENIYDKTNLYQGPQDQPGFRQYINDTGLTTKRLPKNVPSEGIPFQDVVDWPEMFNNYPHTSDIPVRFNKPGGAYGWDKFIDLPGSARTSGINNRQLSTLAHEGQHAIGNHEGWSAGKNHNSMVDWARVKLDYRNKVFGTPDEEYWHYQNPGVEKFVKELGTDPATVGYQMYRRDPGEVEARLQQALLRRIKQNDTSVLNPPHLYTQDEAIDRFKNAGLALDSTNYGRLNEYGLRQWMTPNQVDPNTLDNNLRNVFDYLPATNGRNNVPVGQFDYNKTGKLYPWKFEDYPREFQNDFNLRW